MPNWSLIVYDIIWMAAVIGAATVTLTVVYRSMEEAMKKVNVRPDGYIWTCPDCGEINTEMELPDEKVECARCDKTFKIELSLLED